MAFNYATYYPSFVVKLLPTNKYSAKGTGLK